MAIQGKYYSYQDELIDVYHIRKEVFPIQHGITEENNSDMLDRKAIHAVVYDDIKLKNAVAAGRILLYEETAEISKLAVLKEYRHKKYGELVIRMLIDKAINSKIQKIYLYSPTETVIFFEKLGFKLINESSVNTDNIYIRMEYDESKKRKCC